MDHDGIGGDSYLHAMRLAPAGYAGVLEAFGDPKELIREDGTVSPFWEARMTKVPFPDPLPLGWKPDTLVRSARLNVAVASETEWVFRVLKREDLWRHLKTYDGGYAWRTQRGSTTKLSMHAFGVALDFNAATNGLGEKGDMHPDVVQVFESCGWTWGGRFKRPDPMHFQYARGV